MRFINESGSERASQEPISRNIIGPGLAECAGEREQHRTRYKRNHGAPIAHDIPAGVYDKRIGR